MPITELVNQPTAAPTQKIQAVGIGGALSIIGIFLVGQFEIVIPPEVAASVVLVVSWLAGYFKRNKVTDV